MQREAQAVADWTELNGLKLNLKKSKVMLLLGKRTSRQISLTLATSHPLK